MREIRRRLGELKKENEELKTLLSISGKNRHEYETKVNAFNPNKSTKNIDFFCLIRFKS